MNNPTIKICIRKENQKKDLTCPVVLRLTIARKPRNYNLFISVRPDQWDEKKSEVRKNHPAYINYNKLIKNALQKAGDILLKYSLDNKQLSFDEFNKHYSGSENKTQSFYDFWENEIILSKGKASNETIRSYTTQLSKLRAYKSKLNFNDLDVTFIREYEKHLITDLKNCQNTVKNSLKTVKSMFNRAIKRGYTDNDNPFKNHKIGAIVGNRQFLTKDEVLILQNYYNKNKAKIKPGEKQVLKCFLFSCYTGLRYGDIRKFNFSNIIDNMIVLKMNKTKDIVKIPLIKESKALIENMYTEHFNNQNVFNVYSNQYLNDYLKDIFISAKINKSISFHCARHTFATMGISLGIEIGVLSKILGHKKIATTQIYTHYVDDDLIKAMGKFNNLKNKNSAA